MTIATHNTTTWAECVSESHDAIRMCYKHAAEQQEHEARQSQRESGDALILSIVCGVLAVAFAPLVLGLIACCAWGIK